MSKKWIESNKNHDNKETIKRLLSEPDTKEYLKSLSAYKRDKLLKNAVSSGNETEDMEIFTKLDRSQPWLDKTPVTNETKKGGRKRRSKRRSKKQRKTRKSRRK